MTQGEAPPPRLAPSSKMALASLLPPELPVNQAGFFGLGGACDLHVPAPREPLGPPGLATAACGVPAAEDAGIELLHGTTTLGFKVGEGRAPPTGSRVMGEPLRHSVGQDRTEGWAAVLAPTCWLRLASLTPQPGRPSWPRSAGLSRWLRLASLLSGVRSHLDLAMPGPSYWPQLVSDRRGQPSWPCVHWLRLASLAFWVPTLGNVFWHCSRLACRPLSCLPG